jgi:hypothetical protein
LISIDYLRNAIQQRKAVVNHTGMLATVAANAETLRRINSRLTTIAYTNSAAAPAIMERASIAAYDLPSLAIVSASVADATDGAAPKVRQSSWA